MRKTEALQLARQLDIELPAKGTANALSDYCLERGLELAVCHDTGAWLILENNVLIARCA